MRVFDIKVVTSGPICELQGRVESDLEEDDDDWFAPVTLWYRFPAWCGPFLSSDNGDPFLAALLLAAMRNGERLAISATVSPRLLEALPDIQAIYGCFDPQAKPIPVEAPARDKALPADGSAPGVGLFFSLGVDSFYSLLKNRRDHPHDEQTITHLIFVHGFELGHGQWHSAFPDTILANLNQVGRETGTAPLPVVTNVQRVIAGLAPWTLAHGGGLASIALALGRLFGCMHIAATTTYDRLYPWGTHPVLDPLWSTEELEFVHDGCELHTIDKTALVAGSPLVLETLRVCPGYGPGYNCGQCLKCLRTMIDLRLAGALDRCRTLPHEIDTTRLHDALRSGRSPEHIAGFQRRLEMLAALGGPPDLRNALAAHLARLRDEPSGGPPRRLAFIARWWRHRRDLD